ncbi:heme-binding protein [Streptomyces sp. MK7]|uniref:GlcG/HbpS family heme-binding protein n=1 Tax=Streptomyces sp. MK7 TaxID=3067635 RepID=UPI00292E5620|nr:heme-binding protein [Streptomyces sp. MK7]
MQHKARKFSTRAKVVTSAAALAAVGAGVTGAVSASADTTDGTPAAAVTGVKGKATTTTDHLTIQAATDAAQAALEAAQKEGQRVSVAVVDRDGNTLVTLRGDGAGPQAYESAVKKAYTAVAWNAPTSQLTERLESAPTLKDIPGTLFLARGAPVAHDNTPIAGVGVAGAPSGDLDEKSARAGIAAVSNGR